GKECGTGIFGKSVKIRVEQARAPEPVAALNCGDRGGHLLELLNKRLPVGITLGHVLQRTYKACDYPAVAARPKNFLAVGMSLVEEPRIAKKKVLAAVIQTAGSCPP